MLPCAGPSALTDPAPGLTAYVARRRLIGAATAIGRPRQCRGKSLQGQVRVGWGRALRDDLAASEGRRSRTRLGGLDVAAGVVSVTACRRNDRMVGGISTALHTWPR